MIGDKLVCKPIVKFKVFLGSLIKKCTTIWNNSFFIYKILGLLHLAFPLSFNNTLEKLESASSASCNYSKNL